MNLWTHELNDMLYLIINKFIDDF